MDIDRLSSVELGYELAIRGIATTGTVSQSRTQLRAAIKREKTDGFEEWSEYPFDFTEDSNAVTTGLTSLEGLIDEFDDSIHGGAYKKLNTKIVHLGNRINRMIASADQEEEVKEGLRGRLVLARDNLAKKVQDFEKSLMAISTSELRPSPSTPTQQSAQANMSTSTPVQATHASHSCSHVSFDVKPVPVREWGLKFTGEKDGLSLSAFLERVDELRLARNISLEVLFDSAIDLFSGKALLWYRAYKNVADNWDDLATFLREEFQPHNYDEKLFEEIKRRTQGPDESIGVYTAIMQNLFNRLNVKVPEDFKMKVLMQNIAPFYQDELSLTSVGSIPELLKLGRQLESRKTALEEFRPPPKKSSGRTLEPDLAYVYSEPSGPTSRSREVGALEATCWNCNEGGHIASRCPKPLKKRCFRCGKLGVTIRTCSVCSNSGNARRGR